MRIGAESRVLVAHRRAPVMRMIRANLALEQISVQSVLTASACLAALEEGGVAALILDADLTRETTPHGQELYDAVKRSHVPVLVLSFDPMDRQVARGLHNAPFCSRPDRVDEVVELIQGLLAASHPA
jgi:DNA-binding response OmpR family regulator